MRRVQTGYESCADEYQVRIKSLNSRKQQAKEARARPLPSSSAGGGARNDDPDADEENVQLLCCSFQQYLHCSEGIVNSTCGYETARFTKSFLDRMSGPLIQVSRFGFFISCEIYS
jgi:hypothetical protein